MSKVYIYKTKPGKIHRSDFLKIAKKLGLGKKVVETDEAMAINNSEKALVYCQPGAKMGGTLFYTDQTQSMGAITKRLVDEKSAKRWSDKFLKDFDLLPREVDDERIEFEFRTGSYRANAVSFDGKERKTCKVKTEVSSKTTLNGIHVTGPRAKVRIVFKERDHPAMIHRGFWDTIEIFEERELVREHDIAKAVKEKLATRAKNDNYHNILDIRLAYFATAFKGGPDLLAPYYFIDVAFEDQKSREMGIKDMPKQMLWLPAYR